MIIARVILSFITRDLGLQLFGKHLVCQSSVQFRIVREVLVIIQKER